MTNQVSKSTLANLGLGASYSSVDHRYNLFEADVPDVVKQQAQAVACLIKRDKLHHSSKGYYEFNELSTLADDHDLPLAKNVKFRNESVIGFGTAFLVAPNLVLTAAHCITHKNGKLNKDLIENTRLVFNLQLKSSGKLPSSIKEVEVYRYSSHNILWSNGNEDEDWALLELDKEVKGVAPIELDFSPIHPKTEVYMLGHPDGLAMKFTNSGVIQSSEESNFSAAIDAFHGNSGGPVFNKTTNKAIGILVAGNKDYNTEEMVTIYHRVKKGEGFETCQKISAISQEAIDKIYRANHPKIKKVKRKISKKEEKIPPKSQSHQLAAQTPKVEELYANWERNNKGPSKRAKQVHTSSKREVDPVCEVCIIF